jgi:hypothetical protein
VDKLGRCTCGPDVTYALNSVLWEVQHAYDGWDAGQRRSACLSVIGLNPKVDYASAWDIEELAYDTYLSEHTLGKMSPIPKGGGVGCEYTVQVAGGCFHAAQVNYALFGKIYSMCAADPAVQFLGYNPFLNIPPGFFVIAHKESFWRQKPTDQEVIEALDFTVYPNGGFRSTVSECALSGNKFNGAFHWTWEPIKHREF